MTIKKKTINRLFEKNDHFAKKYSSTYVHNCHGKMFMNCGLNGLLPTIFLIQPSLTIFYLPTSRVDFTKTIPPDNEIMLKKTHILITLKNHYIPKGWKRWSEIGRSRWCAFWRICFTASLQSIRAEAIPIIAKIKNTTLSIAFFNLSECVQSILHSLFLIEELIEHRKLGEKGSPDFDRFWNSNI